MELLGATRTKSALTSGHDLREKTGWYGTSHEYRSETPGDQTVLDLFDAQVAITPEAPAIIFAGRELSYRELDRRARRLAQTLRALGVGRDVLVGISLDRSFDMLIAVLAVLKAGGAYVALDLSDPQERLNYILGDARPSVLVTRSSQTTRFPDYRGQVLAIDEIDGRNSDQGSGTGETSRVAPADDGNALAYVVYTSGSTGVPKGVAMEHRPLFNLVSWQLRSSPNRAVRRTLQFAPLAFDPSLEEIFGTWCAGGALVLLTEEVRRDPEALCDLIEEAGIARIILPYVALQTLALAAAVRKATPQSLREVIVGGETLRITEEIEGFFGRSRDCVLVNQYGPSEAHVYVTSFELSGDPQSWPTLPPIGKPVADARIHILDESRRPVPVGIPGEIYIGGDALARGYLNKPELTAERFVVDPFENSDAGGRLYRTGDLARRLSDGNIEFLGRLDRQMKLRGYRIEPGEIEVALARHPRVRQAVVDLYEPMPGDKRLVAYVVPQGGTGPAASELLRFLRERLPPYMVPATVMLIDAVPLTPSGKIDRDRLPNPEQARQSQTTAQIQPRNEIEGRLAAIWAKLLMNKSIGATDNFFEIGGDSLLALRLAAEIEDAFDRTLSLGVIFSAPTIERLARILDDDFSFSTAFSLVPLQNAGSRPPVFFVHWIPHQLVRRLGTEHPVYGLFYGLAAQTAHSSVVLPERIEDLAAHYVEEMRSVQPQGPYTLIGFSAGGFVAFEMARQLRAQGETIGFLGLVDTLVCSHHAESEFARLPLFRQVANFFRLPPIEIWLMVKSFYALQMRHMWPGLARSRADDTRLEHLVAESMRRLDLWSWYVPELCFRELTLFTAKEPFSIRSRCPAVASAWRELTDGQVEIHEIPGRHATVASEPNVRVLAAKLRACLERRP